VRVAACVCVLNTRFRRVGGAHAHQRNIGSTSSFSSTACKLFLDCCSLERLLFEWLYVLDSFNLGSERVDHVKLLPHVLSSEQRDSRTLLLPARDGCCSMEGIVCGPQLRLRVRLAVREATHSDAMPLAMQVQHAFSSRTNSHLVFRCLQREQAPIRGCAPCAWPKQKFVCCDSRR